MSATSSASASQVPAVTGSWPSPDTRSPAWRTTFAAASAAARSVGAMPNAASRVASISTTTVRSGAPTVKTSRVPRTRLSAISSVCATSPSSVALFRPSLDSVSVMTGTSSMPIGRTRGCPTPSPAGAQSCRE